MSYLAPPQFSRIAPLIVVAATLTTLVIAPGAGKRIRVVGWHVMVNKASTGVADFALQDGAAAIYDQATGLSVAGTPYAAPPNFPEPGLQLPDNSALVINESSTIATGNYVAVAYYYIDSVT